MKKCKCGDKEFPVPIINQWYLPYGIDQIWEKERQFLKIQPFKVVEIYQAEGRKKINAIPYDAECGDEFFVTVEYLDDDNGCGVLKERVFYEFRHQFGHWKSISETTLEEIMNTVSFIKLQNMGKRRNP